MNTKHHKQNCLAALAMLLTAIPFVGVAEEKASRTEATPVPSPGYWLPGFWDRSDASRIWHDPTFVPQKATAERDTTTKTDKQQPVIRPGTRYGAGAPVPQD